MKDPLSVCDAPVDHLFGRLPADRADIAKMLLLERHAAGGHARLFLHLHFAFQLAAALSRRFPAQDSISAGGRRGWWLW